jgi:predicted RNase H-like HicB family nuclease
LAPDIRCTVEGYGMLKIEFEQEEDGRWIADIPELAGVMAYGATREDAQSKVEALALRTLADRLDHGESIPELAQLFVVPAA